MTDENVSAEYTFTNTDIPDATWSADRLAVFVKTLGKRTMTDRWRIGRAVNIATANMTKTARDQWIADVLPGWSRSTIDRMKKIAKTFPTPDDICEDLLNPKKKTDEERKEKMKVKRDAHKAALVMVAELERENPKMRKKLAELLELIEKFAPAHPAHMDADEAE